MANDDLINALSQTYASMHSAGDLRNKLAGDPSIPGPTPYDDAMSQARGLQSGMLHADPVEMAMGLVAPKIPFPARLSNPIRAYHGSPVAHEIESLDPSMSRTGFTSSGEVHFYRDPAGAEHFRDMSGWGQSAKPGAAGVIEADLHTDPGRLLDLSTLISKQHPEVQAAISRALAPYRTESSEAFANTNGQGLLKHFRRDLQADPAAALRAEGLHGFSYKDSPNGRDVLGIWSPEIIEILRKYGLMGPAALGAASAALPPDKAPQQ